jgi:hypothetical protein
MNRSTRSNIAAGVLLILAGALALLVRFVPGLSEYLAISDNWPLIVVAVGFGLLLFGLLIGAPGMAVPACIVGGIGGILYYQNATGDWESWAYIWALIPGFVGIGVILQGLIEGRIRHALGEGINTIIVSLVLFFIFGSFLGGFGFGWNYWPILLIILGAWMLIRPLLRRRKQPSLD